MSDVEQVAEVLETAADILEKSGWTTGALVVFGRHCSVGAIHAATDDALLRGRAKRALVQTLKENEVEGFNGEWEDPDRSIVSWNDGASPGGKKVTEMFRKAAKEVQLRDIDKSLRA